MKDVLRTNWIKQGQSSLLRIVSFFREESLPQIVSGTYDPNAILKNLSDQDICSDSKELIDRERNAVDLYDQRDSKGHILFSSFMIWNILDKIFVPIHVQSNSLSAIQQFQMEGNQAGSLRHRKSGGATANSQQEQAVRARIQ